MIKFKTFINESGVGLGKVVFGDHGRSGQGFIRKFLDSIFNNSQLKAPKFGMESTIKNLKNAKLTDSEIKDIRKAVISAMESTIKELNINSKFVFDHKDKLFERYSLYDDGVMPGVSNMKPVTLAKQKKVYTAARVKIEAALEKLNIVFEGVDMKGFKDSINESIEMMEGLRGDDFYYEWYLINKSEADAIQAVKANGFEEYGSDTYRNSTTKEMANIRHTTKGWKIDISDSHGKRMA